MEAGYDASFQIFLVDDTGQGEPNAFLLLGMDSKS